MMDHDVSMPPIKGGPSGGEGPEPAKPDVQPVEAKYSTVRVVVEIDSQIDAGTPSEHDRCASDKGQP